MQPRARPSGVPYYATARSTRVSQRVRFRQAEQVFSNEQIFITDTVLLETEWVLRFSYGFKPNDIRRALKKIFGLPNVYISNPQQLKTTLRLYKAGLNFADAIHLSANLNHHTFVTFDKKFIQRAKGKTKCIVKEP
ncbi:MAG: type II toxin-antitoxin system VapC family toxin [Candidatus Electrothrix sp. AR4]|nr:type II toxin-antitoxin system VapC family toxin [Candidatus Electrothrix sp. AR4]